MMTYEDVTYKNKYNYPIIGMPQNWKKLEQSVAHVL